MTRRWKIPFTPSLASAGILIALVVPAPAQDGCLSWDRTVTLEGYILDGVFPGPPEFEDVETGDARLEASLLYLAEPVCVSGDDALDAEPVEATELVQLACPEAAISARGRLVALTGTLFSAHTGYHRTPALLQCDE